MIVLSRRIELPNMATVQGTHHADPGEHRGAAEIGDQHQRLDRGLPFGQGDLRVTLPPFDRGRQLEFSARCPAFTLAKLVRSQL
jgi:hypothetical protein